MSYRKVFLIGNPIAGGGALRKIKKAEEILKNKGISVETLLTEKPGDAQRFAEQIKNSRETLVIAAGGDGTYNEVVNGLAFSETPMAILPMGTTSVLAKELKIPKNLKKAIEVAITGNVQKIHLGRIKIKKNKDFLFLWQVLALMAKQCIMLTQVKKGI